MNVNALGAKMGPFYVLVGAHMPAVLVECGFLSNADEAARLASRAVPADCWRDGIADAGRGLFQTPTRRWETCERGAEREPRSRRCRTTVSGRRAARMRCSREFDASTTPGADRARLSRVGARRTGASVISPARAAARSCRDTRPRWTICCARCFATPTPSMAGALPSSIRDSRWSRAAATDAAS